MPELQTDAIAIYLDLRVRTDADDLDDTLAEELGLVLDLAEERLRDAGLTLVSVTGSEILARAPALRRAAASRCWSARR